MALPGEDEFVKLRVSEAQIVSDTLARAALATRQAQKLSQAATKAR